MWIMCDECGSTLRATGGRCPVCGHHVPPPGPWDGPRHLLTVLVVTWFVAAAILGALLFTGAPELL